MKDSEKKIHKGLSPDELLLPGIYLTNGIYVISTGVGQTPIKHHRDLELQVSVHIENTRSSSFFDWYTNEIEPKISGFLLTGFLGSRQSEMLSDYVYFIPAGETNLRHHLRYMPNGQVEEIKLAFLADIAAKK